MIKQFVNTGSTAALTNTILAENATGVNVAAGGIVNLTQTLWDRNTKPVVGTINETGRIDGPAGFDWDGYHLTRFSMAIERGVGAGLVDDIDGGSRPMPAGTLPDLGADEYLFSLETDLIAEKLAFAPKSISIFDSKTGQVTYEILQRYLLRFYHGSAVAEALDIRLTDTLPDALALANEQHTPALDFASAGQRLTWNTVTPLGVNEAIEVVLDTYGRPKPKETLVNRASIDAGSYHLDMEVTTTAPFFPPLITSIGNGEYCYLSDVVNVSGVALSNSLIRVFENGTEVITTTSDANGVFTSTYQSLHITEPITVTAKTCLLSSPKECSPESQAVHLAPANSFWDPQRSSVHVTGVNGARTRRADLSFRRYGKFTTGYVGWWLPGFFDYPQTSSTTDVRIYICEHHKDVEPRIKVGEVVITGQKVGRTWIFQYNGRPPFKVCNSNGANCNSSAVLIDPDGYVFDVTQGLNPITPTLTTLQGITVTCMVSMPMQGGWAPWPAHLYENQVNPQVTEGDGYFAFFTPPGHYYLQVDGIAGFQSWRSPVIEVIDEIVHVNVPLTPWSAPADYTITLTPSGPSLPALTVEPGSMLEWLAPWDNMTLPEQLLALVENPVLRLLSAINPLHNALGFDSGKLTPGSSYRRQFTTPGVYQYSDGMGHSGVITVKGATGRIYLPLVVRNP